MANTEPTQIPAWTIQDRLRKARETVGLSQQQLAETIDVSPRTVSRYESAEVQPRKLVVKVWALACGVPFEWVWSGHHPGMPGGNESGSSAAVGDVTPRFHHVRPDQQRRVA